MEVITRWLQGSQNFIVGKLYYKQFGKDKSLIELFDKGETPFAKAQLKTALEALLLHATEAPVTIPLIKDQANPVTAIPKGDDDITIALEQEYRPLYQRMNFLRHEMDKYGDDNTPPVMEQCRLLGVEILELEKRCMLIWEKLDYYRVHKQLPELKTEEFTIPTDPVEVALLIQSLKKNIQRNKLKAKTPGAKQAYYLNLVKKYEAQLAQIKSKP